MEYGVGKRDLRVEENKSASIHRAENHRDRSYIERNPRNVERSPRSQPALLERISTNVATVRGKTLCL